MIPNKIDVLTCSVFGPEQASSTIFFMIPKNVTSEESEEEEKR